MKVLIDGVEYEITVTDDQEAGSWAELQAQFDSASTEENNPTLITLTGNVTAGEGDSALVIQTDKYVTLDLAGHTIDRGLAGEDKNPAENGSVITVSGNLTLSDNSTGHTGKITGGNSTRNGGGVIVSGTFTMEGGTIDPCIAINDESCGGGVYVDGGTFTMEGGTISGCSTIGLGGGVFVDENGTFTMNSGMISGCSAVESGGGGVYVASDTSSRGTFTMNGGMISGCSASNGGGVFSHGTFTMKDGTIDNCTAHYSGSGVYVGGGTFTMNGGAITGCKVEGEYSRNGGGVYVDEGSTFTMSGGTITGCRAGEGGGVFVNDNCTFQVSGAPVISGNKKESTSANNVELDSGTTITVTGALIPGAEIYVNAGKGDVVATGENYTLQASDADAFHSDADSSLTAALDSDGTVKFVNPWGALQLKFNNASTSSQQPTQITLTGDVTADEDDSALLIPAGRYVTLDLNGHTIDRGLAGQPVGNNGNVITVSGNLTLTDNSSAHTGTITGGNWTGLGGGVSVKSNGEFTMQGGTISGCNA
jgi:hypothetical protein